MPIHDIISLLKTNPYPGRGIVLGRSVDNCSALLVYFIMGRSENSRNRIFAETPDGIETQAHDPLKLADPSLVIYHPVRRIEANGDILHIVTNGDQTETIKDYLMEGKSYLDALMTREFEPDPPIYTPRISGMLFPYGSYMLSILKSLDMSPDCCSRHFFTYDFPQPGEGHYICTYQGDGNPPLSFDGEPLRVSLPQGGLGEIADSLWSAMNSDNKVSLYVSEIDLVNRESMAIVKNKNRGD